MIMNALLSAFPSIASFYDFKENDREISRRAIPGIIRYAFDHAIIESNSEEAFVTFLTRHGTADTPVRKPAGLAFSDVLDTLSGSLSVNALIAQLEVTARELSLPAVQAPMITRLKKRFVMNTPKKRALLRILAFKLGQKHPDLNWNYDLLLQLPACTEDQPGIPQETAGVTVMFHLQAQGAVIVPADVSWLKNELAACIDYLKLENHIHKKVIETTGTTSFNLRAPKKPGPPDEPRLYNEAIRNVMAIAHQMSARWLLSENSTPQKKMVVIVHAGRMSEAHSTIQKILDIPSQKEAGIYLTDFAHLCALYASVKAGFEPYARDSYPGVADSGNVWSVNNFLSYSYYDYIPCLLTEKMLPQSVNDPSYEDFRRSLHFPEQAGYCSFGAITAMHRFPQSALLLTEIAKVLRARQMPFEADTVLSHLLLTSPRNLAARLMRMMIYLNIAQSQSDYHSAKLAFDRAQAEGDFIVGSCEPESDLWHEIGVLHFSQVIKYFKFFHEKNSAGKTRVQKADLLDHLFQARDAFMKSMTVSATGKALNSLYMFSYTLCLIELLSGEEKPAGRSPKITPAYIRRVFRNVGTRIFHNIGWLRNETPSTDGNLEKIFQNLLLTINLVIARYENLVLCRSNIPHLKYMFAMILWDFAPWISLELCRITLGWLRIARDETKKLIPDNISVYHVACGSISAEKFLSHIQDTMDIIQSHLSDEDLKQENDSPLIRKKLKELSGVKLILLELERLHARPMIPPA